MPRFRHPYLLVLILSALGVPATSGAQGTRADYDRAASLRETTRDRVFRDRVRPQWNDAGTRFWYRVDTAPGEYEFIVVDAVAAVREPAFDHASLADLITRESGATVDRNALPVRRIEFTDDPNLLTVVTDSARWTVNRESGGIERMEDRPPDVRSDSSERRETGKRRNPPVNAGASGQLSPDGRWLAYVRDHRLHVRPARPQHGTTASDSESSDGAVALTLQGSPANTYRNRDIFWSPDSKKILALRWRAGDTHKVSFVESSPTDQLQPKLHTFDYLKPGDEIPQPFPHLFDLETRQEISLSTDQLPNPWMARPRIHWDPDSSRCFHVYNQRGHQVLRVLAIDASTGTVTPVVDEHSSTFIDYAYKQFLHFLHETDELIWMSERDGWNHLYLYSSTTGQVKAQITQGAWVVRRVDHVDEERRQIWFRAGGIHPDQDHCYEHYCRVNFDGTGLRVLTSGNGDHDVRYSPDRKFLVDTWSRVDAPPVTELRNGDDGTLICELERANWSRLLETGWQVPKRFVARGRDGETDIFGVLYRPSTFNPEQRYPVIEKIYAGPHGSFVPKSFSAFHSAQELAELGFIVVQIDGMGTSGRSKAFHDVCWKNLGDSGFPDRILWIRAAAAAFPWMDLSRGVGIYGGSAGGQSSTRALLAFGDFYTVAVSDCGCHDNRMDKIWWNELWMGWPIGPHYAAQSNVTNAHRLSGQLLLTVGELDRNVDPASTMQVVNALIEADRDFELIVFPGKGHGIGESAYGKRRRRDFFVRHLLGVEPRRE